MSDSRPSLPPGDASLKTVADNHRKLNDQLEKSVGHVPLPASVAIATLDLTPEQELAVCRRLWILHNRLGNAHMSDTLHTFERLARERIAKP